MMLGACSHLRGKFSGHLLFPPIFANYARIDRPSTDDGKTVVHPFFLPNEAHHGDPRSWLLHICKVRYKHIRGWPIPLPITCESFSFIGLFLYEKIQFITINQYPKSQKRAADEKRYKKSHSSPIPPESQRYAPKTFNEMIIWLIVVFFIRIFHPIGRC